MFSKKIKPGDYEVVREGDEEIIKINYDGLNIIPSIEDSQECMSDTIDKLVQIPMANRIVFYQRRKYEYDYKQTQILREIANIYAHLIRQKKLINLISVRQDKADVMDLRDLVVNYLKADPIGTFIILKRLLREEKIKLKNLYARKDLKYLRANVEIMEYIYSLLEKSKLIRITEDNLDGIRVGSRIPYKTVFRANITPEFMLTRAMPTVPLDAIEIDAYKIRGENDVTIYKTKNDIKYLYQLEPIEFKVTEDEYDLIETARQVLSEHQPKSEEFVNPEKIRQTFFNIGKDLITELAEHKNIELDYDKIKRLAEILVRYTVGFGVIEVLLQDEKIQDISVNGPIGETPIFIVHQDYDECVTNLVPSKEDGDGWATKFRLLSGRPLDEANPVLDTELIVPGGKARVAIISNPLNPLGLGYSFRRHRDMPWTLPLFIKNGMINSLAAGLISFLIDGNRTILVAGSRSSGKCVDGNTVIQLGDGRLIKIMDLIGEKSQDIQDGEIYHSKENIKAISLDKFNLRESNITRVWKRTSPVKLVRLKTISGKEIVTTSEHPYFIYKDGLKNIRADSLEIGNVIATPRKVNILGREVFIDLSREPYCRHVFVDYYVIRGKTNSLTFTFPRKVIPDLAEFIGLIVGDGHVDSNKIEFHNSCLGVRERYKELLKIFNVKYREFKSNTTNVVQITSRFLSNILHDYFEIPFGKKSDIVVIPKLILMSGNEVLSSFLKGYFTADGYIPNNKRDIELVTASKEMAECLRLALLRFNIIVFTKTKIIKNKPYNRIFIRGEFVNEFGKYIGFSHPLKKYRLESILRKKFLENTNIDIIPHGHEIINELRKKLRISPRQFRLCGKDYWAYENNTYRVTRRSFNRIINFYLKRYDQLCSLKGQVDKLRSLLFDYSEYIDKIIRLKELLDISYVTIANDLKFSDTYVRKVFHRRASAPSFKTVQKLNLINKILETKLSDFEKAYVLEPKLKDLALFVETGIGYYATMSKDISVPETSLKSYAYGGINPSIKTKEIIEDNLLSIKESLGSKLMHSKYLLKDLYIRIPDYVQIGAILSNIRNLLSIKNEELVSENVSIGTISNFFNAKHTCDFIIIQNICRKTIEIYDKCVSNETLNLVIEALNLANSDIFWDEVSLVEKIDRIDDFVYDLTVENTHNFIANGFIAHNTSFLGSMMVEIMRKYRIITVEDTLELGTETFRKFGYNIQPMKVRAALAVAGGSEVTADEGIRSSLRMGDSSLIVGEIRSIESLALFEAMRVGALANVVAGTIHGDSPYGVFDRLVNDLKVPRTSFKATDIIIVANPIKTGDGLHKKRRIVSITEVRKEWENDPINENGFVELMRYNPITDQLEFTDSLTNGDSEILKSIAGNVKEWAGNWDSVWENIMLRASIKKAIVDYSNMFNDSSVLEAEFVMKSNDEFHRISDSVRNKTGILDSNKIFMEWREWFRKQVNYKK